MILINADKLNQFNEEMLALEEKGAIVGVSVAVISHNNLVYSDGFGRRSLSPEEPINPDTIMSIQSLSKSFAALSIMQLVEKGLIELDTPLVNYLPYFQTTNKEESDQITVRQILSHTSGLPGDIGIANLACANRAEVRGFQEWQDELGISDEVLDRIKSFEDITRYINRVELKNKPGQQWEYCTDAYSIVGDLFEKVSGVSWFEHVTKNIFAKLELSRTTLDPEKAKEDQNRSKFYSQSDTSFVETAFPMNKVAAPAGFIYSTAKDLAVYLAANMEEQDTSLIRAESMKEMQRPYPNVKSTIPFEDIIEPGYGLGWGISEYKGLKFIDHGGGYPGVSCWVVMVPSQKLGVVALANYDKTNTREITMKLIDIFLDK